ncbi:hypothetical protein ACCO46_14690, partial [Gordonia sihwensis]
MTAEGGRRNRTWARSTMTLEAAAETSGAATRARELATRINGERASWHAESRKESARARRGLEVLRKRLHHDLTSENEMLCGEAQRVGR